MNAFTLTIHSLMMSVECQNTNIVQLFSMLDKTNPDRQMGKLESLSPLGSRNDSDALLD